MIFIMVDEIIKIDFFIVGVGFVGVVLVCFFLFYGCKGIIILVVFGMVYMFRVYIINMVVLECLRDIGLDW